MQDSIIIKKYRTEFLGSVLILKFEDNTIILENRTLRYQEKFSRILRDNIKKTKSPKEQYILLLKAASSNCQELDNVSFLIWQEMR